MIIKNKDKFYNKLFIYKHLKFIKFYSDINDYDLQQVIKALNIKNRFRRIKFIISEGANYIDNYYKECNLCHFKNNKCICHRKTNKGYINGCCRKCRYQSNKGCTTKNVACKLFNCSYVDYNGKNKLNINDIKLFKLLNPYQRYILSNDYFIDLNTASIDLYVGPIFLLFRMIVRIVLWVI